MHKLIGAVALVAVSCAHPSFARAAPAGDASQHGSGSSDELKPEETRSKGAVTIAGHRVDYTAVAGTLVVRPGGGDTSSEPTAPAAAMSYVAYFAAGGTSTRPVMFLYNGGPGSSTMWLHMGAFGPRRVITGGDAPTGAAPYRVVDNAYSLLDATDLVFIDAPGTGFGAVAGNDKAKLFYGIDPDAHAFADFILQFLSKYGRWNSPKYLFGESYGTARSAVLANVLQQEKMVDLNGVILLSQILCFDASPDGAENNPGVDLPYILALPTYAATAWYHKKLPDPPSTFDALIADVEKFALGEYAAGLAAGNALEPAQRKAMLDKLHRFTGLPITYLDKANLRVSSGEFAKALQDDAGLTTGQLDSRFSGPTLDRLGKEAEYDPQASAMGSAYLSAYNDYARKQLGVAADRVYKPRIRVFDIWSWKHEPPSGPAGRFALPSNTNVMPDLAAAMTFNPHLAVQLEAGYFDLATPFFQSIYELQHLALSPALQRNLDMKFYPSGHMIYANEPSLRALHDNVATFVRRTSNGKPS